MLGPLLLNVIDTSIFHHPRRLTSDRNVSIVEVALSQGLWKTLFPVNLHLFIITQRSRIISIGKQWQFERSNSGYRAVFNNEVFISRTNYRNVINTTRQPWAGRMRMTTPAQLTRLKRGIGPTFVLSYEVICVTMREIECSFAGIKRRAVRLSHSIVFFDRLYHNENSR